MNGRTVATIRGKAKRDEFEKAIGTVEIQIISPLAVRMYRIDPSVFSDEQLKWFVERYGLAIPADECTVSMSE